MKTRHYVINNIHMSNFANFMIKYMCAMRIADEIEGAILSNYIMPYWNIHHAPLNHTAGLPATDFIDDMYLSLNRARYLIEGGVGWINMFGHVQRMENLPSRDFSNALFPLDLRADYKTPDNVIVCPVRGGEILDAIHPGYTLIPIDFYKDIFSKTDLKPFFMGQIEPNLYTDRLRREFPDAIFSPSRGPFVDFQTIRSARRIILPISTFAWLAAWLSDAESIILPVFGLFNPDHFPDHDLLPVFDNRYEFYKFPVQHSVPLNQVEEAHAHLSWFKENPILLARL